jgi:hypothetical protein
MKTYRTKNGYYYKEYQNGKKKRISEEDYIKLKKTSRVKKTSTPIKKKATTVKKKATPVKKKATTVKKKATPVKKKASTIKKKATPVKKKTPIKKKTTPVKKKTTPVKKKTTTVKKKTTPVKKSSKIQKGGQINQVNYNTYKSENQCQHKDGNQCSETTWGFFGVTTRSGFHQCRMCGHMFCKNHCKNLETYSKIKEALSINNPQLERKPILKSGVFKPGNSLLKEYKWMWQGAGVINKHFAREAAKHDPFRWNDISTLESYANQDRQVLLQTPTTYKIYDSVEDLLENLQELLSAEEGKNLKICNNCKTFIDARIADEEEGILKSILQTISYDEQRFITEKETLYRNREKSMPTNVEKLINDAKAMIDKRFIRLIKQYLLIAGWNIYEFYRRGYLRACYNEIHGGEKWSDLVGLLDPDDSNQLREELGNDRIIRIYKESLASDDNITPPWSNETTDCQICLSTTKRMTRHHCRWCGLFVCDGCLLIIHDENARNPKIKDKNPNIYFCKDFCAKEGLKNIFKRKMESDLEHLGKEMRDFLKDSYLKNTLTANNSEVLISDSELSKLLLNKILSNASNNLFTSELSNPILPSFDNINLSEGNTKYRDHPVYEKFYSGLRMMMADFLKNKFLRKLQTKKKELENHELLKTNLQNNVLAVCGFLKNHQSLTYQVTSGHYGEPDVFFSFEEQIRGLKQLTLLYFECPTLFNEQFNPSEGVFGFLRQLFQTQDTTSNDIPINELTYKRIICGPLYIYRNTNSSTKIINVTKAQEITSQLTQANTKIKVIATKMKQCNDRFNTDNTPPLEQLKQLSNLNNQLNSEIVKRRILETQLTFCNPIPSASADIYKRLTEERKISSFNDLFRTTSGNNIFFTNSSIMYYDAPVCNLSSALTRLFHVINTFQVHDPLEYTKILLELEKMTRDTDKFNHIIYKLNLKLTETVCNPANESNSPLKIIYKSMTTHLQYLSSQISKCSSEYAHLFNYINSITITAS